MYLHLKKPLAFFDLETTGTNVSKDRVVEISVVKVFQDGRKETKTHKVNPEIPIPPETSMIHGIYDEDIKDAPTFKQIAREYAEFLQGCDLAGFNILKFDVPMLVEEFLRVNIDFDTKNRKLVDAQKIFHLMEKRNLAAAYKFYCGKELEGAHGAEVDAEATFEILDAQVNRYEGEEATDNLGNPIGKIKNDMNALHEITSSNLVDLAGRMVFNEEGIEIFNFGKHKSRPVSDILNEEPSYYDWMMRGDFPMDTKRRLTEIKLRHLKNG